MLAIDARSTGRGGWEVYVHGGRTPTGMDALEWAREGVARGAGEILLTSMDRDGTKDGFDLALTRTIADAVNVPVIASGGAGTVQHMAEALTDGHASAALAASIFHFGEIRIPDARRRAAARGRAGAPVRRPAPGRGARGPGRSALVIAVPQDLKMDDAGLMPVVVQDRASGDVLMVAWANQEALAKTAETGRAHFWSRSRQALWKKGETSGNVLRVVEARTDCDRDTLLLVVEPAGPTCHTGTRTCFGNETPTAAGMLEELARVIAERAQASPEHSYTARLLAKGPDQVLKKIGEEATELVLAARVQSDERLAEEAADLLYHVLVALHMREMPLSRVMDELRRRRK